MNKQAVKLFAELMRSPCPDPNIPLKIYRIMMKDKSKSAESEFLRFASMLLQDRPDEAIPHLERILTLPKKDLQLFSIKGGCPDGTTNYDTVNYEKLCKAIIRDLKKENLAASRRISKRLHHILRIYCWKEDIIL